MRFGNFQATLRDNPWQVIPTPWVRAAQVRWKARLLTDAIPSAVGVDPSRGGADQFVIAKRFDTWIAPLEKHDGTEAPDGGKGARLIHQSVDGDRTVPIAIDVGGAAGSSVYDQCGDLHLNVSALNGSERSEGRDKSGKLGFVNKRAAWHWRMRELLDPTSDQDIALPPDSQLLADLCAPRWKPTPRGIQVELKVEIVKRLGRSPDCGEAVIYAFAQDGPMMPDGLMDIGADTHTDVSMDQTL